MFEKGLIQIYTGEGKGKTTASVGQGVRACGRGLNVYMIQFLKSSDTGEMNILKDVDGFHVYRFQSERGFFWTLSEEEIKEVKKETDTAIEFIEKTIREKACDVLILDEIMGAISNGLVEIANLLRILEQKPDEMEIIMTGRNVPHELVEIADLVTEMKKIKHPFDKGIGARKGIEY